MKVLETRRELPGRRYLVDAKRMLVQPRTELAVWRDYIQTRRAFRRLRTIPSRAERGVILVVLVRDSILEAKMYLMFCQVLRLRGWRIVVMVPSPSLPRAIRYSQALGADEVLYRNTMVESDPDRYGHRRAIAAQLLSSVTDAASLKAVTYKGSTVGKHVFASAVRETLEGSADPTDPALRPIVERLMVEAVTSVELGEHLTELLDPRLVLLEEANYAGSGPLVDTLVEAGSEIIQTVSSVNDGWLCTRLTKGARNLHPVSLTADSFERLLHEPVPPSMEAEFEEELSRRYSGHYTLMSQNQPSNRKVDDAGVREMLGIDNDKKIAVIYAHVLWDASLFFGTDLYDDYGHWLVETIRGAIENDNINWVVKAHPSNVFRVRHGDVTGEAAEMILLERDFPELPTHISVLRPEADVSSLSLYRHADYGVTVRGTPGMEMATFGKPVLTCGTGHYMNQGFTLDSHSRAQYQERLRTLHLTPSLTEDERLRALRYTHAVFCRRPWRCDLMRVEFNFRDEGFHPLDRNIALTTGELTPDVLLANDDMALFSDWVEGSGADLLSPPLQEN